MLDFGFGSFDAKVNDMARDERGLRLTTCSERAARAFDDAVACSLEYRLRIGSVVGTMLDADPDFV
ncbi:MAG: hypothetical protein ACOCYE_12960, partial [Pseudomonadota bacterium]